MEEAHTVAAVVVVLGEEEDNTVADSLVVLRWGVVRILAGEVGKIVAEEHLGRMGFFDQEVLERTKMLGNKGPYIKGNCCRIYIYI